MIPPIPISAERLMKGLPTVFLFRSPNGHQGEYSFVNLFKDLGEVYAYILTQDEAFPWASYIASFSTGQKPIAISLSSSEVDIYEARAIIPISNKIQVDFRRYLEDFGWKYAYTYAFQAGEENFQLNPNTDAKKDAISALEDLIKILKVLKKDDKGELFSDHQLLKVNTEDLGNNDANQKRWRNDTSTAP